MAGTSPVMMGRALSEQHRAETMAAPSYSPASRVNPALSTT
jgi:hypothetical protein